MDDALQDIREAVRRVEAAVNSHLHDSHAHPEMVDYFRIAYAERTLRMDTLWDERNQLRGTLTLLKWSIPIMGLIGPVLGSLISFTLFHKP